MQIDRPQRKSLRLPNYDYRQNGAYFCSLCVHRSYRSKDVFASVVQDSLQLNRFGVIVEQCWLDIPNHRPSVLLDAFVVMPNHVHLVIFLEGNTQIDSLSNRFGKQPPDSLGMVMGAFKSAVKRQINLLRGEPTLVWQPRFYDRVVRSEVELTSIRRYIESNPANWLNDRCHPQHPKFELAWRGYAPHDDLPDFL